MARRNSQTDPSSKAPLAAARKNNAPAGSPAVESPAWLPWGAALLLAVLTVALYWPATRFGFIDFDDPLYVTQNVHVRQGLSGPTFLWAWTSLEEANWHPLAWISHLIDASLYGVEPSGAWGHHLTSILLHALNSGLALLVFWSFTRRLGPSLLVAALFAWHPLRVESVVWISERKDVLSATFFWLALAAYGAYCRQPENWWRWLLVLGLFALGLAAKPMLVTLPCVLLLLDYWPLGRRPVLASRDAAAQAIGDSRAWERFWPLLREKLPLFALVLASCVITYVAQNKAGAVVDTQAIDVGARVQNALLAYVGYLQKAFWPTNLAFFYPYPLEISALKVAAAAALLALSTGVALLPIVRGRRERGWLPVGWFWFLGMLVPVIGLVQVGSQAMADRYAYLPLAGISLIVAWGLASLVERWPGLRGTVIGAATILAIACGVVTYGQIHVWRDRLSLYAHALKVTENNYTAHSNLASALFEQGLAAQNRETVDAAVAEHQKALEIKPNLGQSLDGLGAAYNALGDYAAAVQAHRAACAASPNQAKPANNLAWLLATCPVADLRSPREAVELATQACRQTGFADPAMLDTLAAAQAAAGLWNEAVETAEKALVLAETQRQQGLLPGIRERLALYRQRQPFIERRSPWETAD